MVYSVLHTTDIEWNDYLKRLPLSKQDVYYSREYYMALEKNGDGLAEMFVYQEKEDIIIYPYLLNEIINYKLDKKYYDIETGYGYGGPIGSKSNNELYFRFRQKFREYCNKTNIVCEFIRFHPLMHNAEIQWKDIDVISNRSTISVDLTKSENEIWQQEISSKNRNMIRKAIKNSLVIDKEENQLEFIKIYKQTMSRLQAKDFYFFSNEYFKAINDVPHVQINVKKENITIASAIFMQYGEYLHYHLSGSMQEYLCYAPNNLLLWEAIKYGKQHNLSKLHLGGGITNSPQDHLYRFKKEFGSKIETFYIGKSVFNHYIYSKLINEWQEKHGETAKMFLQYKY